MGDASHTLINKAMMLAGVSKYARGLEEGASSAPAVAGGTAMDGGGKAFTGQGAKRVTGLNTR